MGSGRFGRGVKAVGMEGMKVEREKVVRVCWLGENGEMKGDQGYEDGLHSQGKYGYVEMV